MQDDEEDWQREVATLATISARSSLDFAENAARVRTDVCRIIPLEAKGAGGMYGTDSTHLCSSAVCGNIEVSTSPLPCQGNVQCIEPIRSTCLTSYKPRLMPAIGTDRLVTEAPSPSYTIGN